jgi:hypothetical protein
MDVQWSDLLLVTVGNADNREATSSPRRRAFLYNWIRQSVAQNRPWNQMVREMYTATRQQPRNGAFISCTRSDPPHRKHHRGVHGSPADLRALPQPPLEKYTQVDYYKMANLLRG